MQTFEPQTPRIRFLYNQLQSQEFRQWIPLILIVILGTILRLYQIGTESIWMDEQFSIRDAESLKLKPRLFYSLFLRFWMLFGDSDGWLRLSSVPFSIGSIILIYLLTLRVANRWTALMAAFAVTISPFSVGYSQEIRMYSMSTFFSLGGTLALSYGLEKLTLKLIIFWLIGRLLSILATPINILIVPADLILIIWRFKDQKKILVRIGQGLIIGGLIWLPFAYALMKAMPKFLQDWVANNPKPNLFLIPVDLITFTAFWPLKSLRFLYESGQKSPGLGWEEMACAFYAIYNLVLIFLLIVGLGQVLKQVKQNPSQSKLLWIALWAIIPFLILLSASYIGGSLLIDRYLTFIAPYYIILLAVGFQTIFQKYRLMALGLALVYLIAVTGGLTHYYTHLYHDDWKGIVSLIEAEQQPGDAIGFYAPVWEPHLALPRYYKGSLPIQPLAEKGIKHPLKLNKKFVGEMLDSLPANKSRYWLILYPRTDVKTIRSVLKERYEILRHEVYPNVMSSPPQVFLIKPKKAKAL